MEISFALWSLHDLIKKLPFDSPVEDDAIHMDFSKLAVPYYVKNWFKVSIFYQDDSYPVDAACLIYSPKNIVTVVFIMKKKFENTFKLWFDTQDEKILDDCCRRRELYCHETCHLIAMIRAYPSDRSTKVREDFLIKLKKKFDKSINAAQDSRVVPLVSIENPGESPSVFDKDHFRYENDSLNFFLLYQELMFPYDRMVDSMPLMVEIHKMGNGITFYDVAKKTFVAKNFFDTFPEKLAGFRQLLAEELFN